MFNRRSPSTPAEKSPRASQATSSPRSPTSPKSLASPKSPGSPGSLASPKGMGTPKSLGSPGRSIGTQTPDLSRSSASTVSSPRFSSEASSRAIGPFIEEEFAKCVKKRDFEEKIYKLKSNDPTVDKMLKASMVRHYKYQKGDEKKSMAVIERSTTRLVGSKAKKH